MRCEIIFSPEAVEDLRKLSARERAMIRAQIEQHLRFEPSQESKSRIKRLRRMSHPQYRLRADGFRIFYDVQSQEVEILAIVPKSLAARWLAAWGE
jgi:mRNA-degrading endonuclease RelE of RelBE toxin-antitoxin system